MSLGFAGFCAIFGAVYEHFSFGVYSNFMIYAFAFPLAAGFLLVLAALREKLPQARTLFLLHLTSVTLAVGSITAGIIYISGRAQKLLLVYLIAGIVLAASTAYSYHADMPEQKA